MPRAIAALFCVIQLVGCGPEKIEQSPQPLPAASVVAPANAPQVTQEAVVCLPSEYVVWRYTAPDQFTVIPEALAGVDRNDVVLVVRQKQLSKFQLTFCGDASSISFVQFKERWPANWSTSYYYAKIVVGDDRKKSDAMKEEFFDRFRELEDTGQAQAFHRNGFQIRMRRQTLESGEFLIVDIEADGDPRPNKEILDWMRSGGYL